MSSATCERDIATDTVGKINRPLYGLHATHATTDDGVETVDPKMINEERLRFDHILHIEFREIELVSFARFWVDRTGTSRTLATAKYIGTNNKIASGINWLTRTYHKIPPALLALFDTMDTSAMVIAA
jgi:hypothetical protein